MSSPKLLVEAVHHVLHKKARNGQTTKREATLDVLGRIEKAGGPTKFGIGAAAMRMALSYLVENEITRQLKFGLTEHEFKHVLPASTPTEVIAALGKTPRWIAINDGSEAIWQFSLMASAEHWFQNAALKEKKAHQTQAKADVSSEIARFLVMNKFNSLAEALHKGV